MVTTPPAQVQEAPAFEGREIAFTGFNQLPLKGSVLPGGDHRYFAVLVSGTGPMDRDWRSPQLPKGRPGLDLATWLQKQGLGSLRYDKRYIGSRDPRLDVSLEAQAGDVKAALAHARSLPEAKGRKLLLVAHSEGCLPGLTAAPMAADAVLLLACPARPMAAVLRAQVESQLPLEQRRDNLAYLDDVLQAIRWDRPRPEPGPGVLPGMGQLARALMAAETLPFVRGTLDLDPLALAGRLPVPTALAWGDRDLQAPRPAGLPQGFRPKVLDRPETNHLLRQESRSVGELTPAKARERYGDGAPLADLSPVSSWLQGLQ